MSLERFHESVDIFAPELDRFTWVKTSLLTLGALGLLTFPAAIFRWDGGIGNRFDSKPVLNSPAFLNRAIRLGCALAAVGLSVTALKLEFEYKENTPLRKMRQETRNILASELLNQKLMELLPGEEEAPQGNPMDQVMALFGKQSPEPEQAQEPLLAELPDAIEHARTRHGVARFDLFRQIGERIVKAMTISDKSVLLASGTGTGKTTTQRYLIAEMSRLYPSITFYALLQKNDSFDGVDEGNVTVFDPRALSEYIHQPKDEPNLSLTDVIKPLYTVYNILIHRKALPFSQRDLLKETKPVRLILDDWYATYNELEARLHKQDFMEVLSMLRQIITVGRDMGVGLVVGSQSANISALGLADDASIRQSLDIYAQGFVSEDRGQHKGELNTIRFVFENPKICNKLERAEIEIAYRLLQDGIQSRELTSPIIFTTVGSNASIGVVPNLNSVVVAAKAFGKSEKIFEDIVEVEFENTTERFQHTEEREFNDVSAESEKLLRAIARACDRKNSEWVKIWEAGGNTNLTKSERDEAIQELVFKELIEVDGKGNVKTL